VVQIHLTPEPIRYSNATPAKLKFGLRSLPIVAPYLTYVFFQFQRLLMPVYRSRFKFLHKNLNLEMSWVVMMKPPMIWQRILLNGRWRQKIREMQINKINYSDFLMSSRNLVSKCPNYFVTVNYSI